MFIFMNKKEIIVYPNIESKKGGEKWRLYKKWH